LKKYFALEVLDSPDVITKRSFKTTSVVRIVRLISIIALINNRHLNNDEKRSLFSVIFRIILFITFSDAVQQQFIFSAKVMTSLISVSAILLLIIFFYGVFGVVLFYGTKEGDDFFSNLLDSMWNLWKSTTSVIYPDVMMSAYNDNRFTALYFVSYMILTYFFFMNVILALVVTSYEKIVTEKKDLIEEFRVKHIQQSYTYLDTESSGFISRSQIMSLISVFNDDYEEIR